MIRDMWRAPRHYRRTTQTLDLLSISLDENVVMVTTFSSREKAEKCKLSEFSVWFWLWIHCLILFRQKTYDLCFINIWTSCSCQGGFLTFALYPDAEAGLFSVFSFFIFASRIWQNLFFSLSVQCFPINCIWKNGRIVTGQCRNVWNLYSLRSPAEGASTSCKKKVSFYRSIWENDHFSLKL